MDELRGQIEVGGQRLRRFDETAIGLDAAAVVAQRHREQRHDAEPAPPLDEGRAWRQVASNYCGQDPVDEVEIARDEAEDRVLGACIHERLDPLVGFLEQRQNLGRERNRRRFDLEFDDGHIQDGSGGRRISVEGHVTRAYEELDHHQTPLGELVLRRRRVPGAGDEPVYEITLGGAFLMSSLVNESERALSKFALDVRGEGAWDVLVGGLGLGYTALEALEDPRVRDVTIVELLPEVIAWHERGLVPLGPTLTSDPRCRFVADDFFGRIEDDETPSYDVIVVDIDHSPEALLHSAHGRFYRQGGLEKLYAHVRPGGVFALWAGAAADPAFLGRLEAVFGTAHADHVRFYNPHVDREDLNAIYVAQRTDPG